jgi:hypothetical protein
VILAFYLGIGFGATVFLLKSPVAREISNSPMKDGWHQVTVTVPLLAASIILTGFWIVGIRAVFSLQVELSANWVFRIVPLRAGSICVSAMRRSLRALALAPALGFSSVLFLTLWPWQPAIEHLVFVMLLCLAITELCLPGNRKIPFTCSWLPGKSNVHIAFWICIMLILEIVLRLAGLERELLDRPGWCAVIAIGLAASAALAAWRTARLADADTEMLQFEEAPSWQLTTLDLRR